jgi:hypothetical protein
MAGVDHEDEFPIEPFEELGPEGGRISSPDGWAIVVRTDAATRLTTLDFEDPEGVLVGSRVLGKEDLDRLVVALNAAWEEARTSNVPVVLDVSAVIGRD